MRKKAVLLKSMVCREGVNKKSFAGMALIFDRIVGNISKRGAWQERGGEK